ncbi:hypothetical protein AGABI1DRAFT_135028 [Agaricus bisporus var. burnettii JB137-S8]|uniref:Uncharacterized protein n=1 Tax=Agaricus bisporus var. burnettii (strain JB137-S8 / ATCC MYA-4627 / FGSC 10392) TaxID=597362 RepID=K5WDK6_AGABU|nr:uncharacterized protein AGABI1DRAFT_135028 [Agaricus bisporus var. burnettii JB137-S8]EKM73331.1 hypothetical protein AGABI1DRAFT_135028 [Agaricus bisporus var. burnettii JB137-S8]
MQPGGLPGPLCSLAGTSNHYRQRQGEGTTIQNPWVFTKLETEPTNAERQETDMFEKLKDTVNSLCESKVRGKLKEINRTATLRYENCPDKGMTPEIKKGTNLRADAYLTVRELDSQSEDFDHRDCSPEVDLADVAVVAEFKKHVKDNVRVSALCSSTPPKF